MRIPKKGAAEKCLFSRRHPFLPNVLSTMMAERLLQYHHDKRLFKTIHHTGK